MTKVKICGLQTFDDLSAVNEFLPDYVGFVFAESPRKITPSTALKLRLCLDRRIEVIGVFVNQDTNFIVELVKNGHIDHIQLHGDEDQSFIADIREALTHYPTCKIIKAFAVKNSIPPLYVGIDYALYDTSSAQRGGSGTCFDWRILQNHKPAPYFLAGGLTVHNIEKAVRLLNPYCLDVSSGVETAGIKDKEKIKDFIALARKEAS